MGKSAIIKVSPEVDEVYPAYIYFPSTNTDDFIIDFTGARRIDTPGLNLLLRRVLRYAKSNQKAPSIITSNDRSIEEVIRLSNFAYAINGYLKEWHNNSTTTLFKDNFVFNEEEPIKCNEKGGYRLNFPINIIHFPDKNDRRAEIEHFQDYAENILVSYDVRINRSLFLTVFKEILKNAADHSDDIATFAFSFYFLNDKCREISFSFSDMGSGIHETVWHKKKEVGDEHRQKHRGIAEAYHMALKQGFSSKVGNGLNLGLGMSLIMHGASSLKMHLSSFDAQSRCVISHMANHQSHKDIRREIYNIGHRSGFSYFGLITI